MQMRMWLGDPAMVQTQVNKFLEGKALDKTVIIHTHLTVNDIAGKTVLTLTVIIFHAETKPWIEETTQ